MPDAGAARSPASIFAAIVGADHVADDPRTRALMSEDIWTRGALCGLVVAPATIEELSRCVAAAAAARMPVLPRGAGMSYTAGYVADTPGAVLIDTRRLAHIDIDAANMIVTVGAGVTWAALHAALKPHGLRTPFWGPLSGISSTIGGGLSQNNAFFGAGSHGAGPDSVVSLRVVTADGAIVSTGAAAKPGAPGFFRHDGPDLTGLFLGDCGALGVKGEASLRLIRVPAHEGWASFSFADRDACAGAMAEIARAGVASELFGFDPELARLRMKRASLLADAATLAKVVTAQKSLLGGVKEGARMALAGRAFLDGADYSIHAVVEGRVRAAVEAGLAEMRAIVSRFGGAEVENTIPKAIRAQPFTPLNNVLGPAGERWAPVHGIVRMDDAVAAWSALEACFAAFKPRFKGMGVAHGYLITTLSTNGFLIEPVFYWPEERFALHDETVEPHVLKKFERFAPNEAATALVREARAAVVDVFTRFGAAHFQIGRTYPFAHTRPPETLALLTALKRALDPHNIMNPGALGLL
ncbi:MAG: FAD-binding protein [Alphaproteobacteria bacterium]|nr:FAD-binding protein [Alphaproteobacteria bacterium]